VSTAGKKFFDFKVTLVHIVCVTIKQDSQYTYKATLRRVPVKTLAVETQRSIKYCVYVCMCILVLIIRLAKYMYRIAL
jgi:hypothetical protein